jgi:hypothetical protein
LERYTFEAIKQSLISHMTRRLMASNIRAARDSSYGEPSQVSGPETREIHKYYNGWIENLGNAIRTQLIAVGQ